MRPLHTLSFILSVFAALFAVVWLWPPQGLALGNNLHLKFVHYDELFTTTKIEYANIDQIVADAAGVLGNETADSLDPMPEQNLMADTIRYSADSLRRVTHRIQFGQRDRNMLAPVFDALHRGQADIRVLHYGDSQIEGDRITSFIRHRLQRQFGGGGPGLLSLAPVITSTVSSRHEFSPNWSRHILFGRNDTTFAHRQFGAMLAYTRFAPENHVSADTLRAWHKVIRSGMAFADASSFSRLRIYYGKATQPVRINLYNADSLIASRMLAPGIDLQIFEHIFPRLLTDLHLEFIGTDSPDFYGMTLDKMGGVAVDNLPLRGSSGLEFSRGDGTFMAQMYRQMNVKLIIMQFGVNVVPNVVEDYTFYENWFLRQLQAVRRHNPGIPIIVIGISDMSRKEGDYYVSYPNITKIRDALRNAAFRADCAFWDMFEAMGGINSMPSWAFANPPLAARDFTHFNYQGSRVIAEMFYNAFDFELRAYSSRSNTGEEPRYMREKIKHQ